MQSLVKQKRASKDRHTILATNDETLPANVENTKDC